ncbi:hypothetical protein QYF36_001995 [Acer negundo]|nr:hypothetical protein QYF36_001995 [Acer negundo]
MSSGFGSQYNIPKQGSETGNNLIHPSPMHQMYYDPSISAGFFKMSGQGSESGNNPIRPSPVQQTQHEPSISPGLAGIHSRSGKVAPPWCYLLYVVYKGVPSTVMWVQKPAILLPKDRQSHSNKRKSKPRQEAHKIETTRAASQTATKNSQKQGLEQSQKLAPEKQTKEHKQAATSNLKKGTTAQDRDLRTTPTPACIPPY